MAASQIVFLTVAIIVLLYVFNVFIKNRGRFEGFLDLPGRSEGQARFNDVMNLVNTLNPQIPLNSTSESQINQATVTPNYTGGLPGAFQQSGVVNSPYKIPTNGSGSAGLDIAKSVCEVVKSTDCGAFDSEKFAKSCGISFDLNGVNAEGDQHMGGMYISPDDRDRLKADKLPMIPTLGKSKQGLFAGDKEECVVISEQLACEKNHTVGQRNCTQCFTSGAYNRIDPRTPRIPPKLIVASSADNVTFSYQGKNTTLTTANGATAELNIADVKEGDTFSLNVDGDPATLFLAGYLQGDTSSGSAFIVDLKNLATIDAITNYAPRLAGTRTINDVRCFVMRPGVGNKTLQIRFVLPYSFIAPMEKESAKCTNGPVVSTAASADFLANDPCYGKNAKPGSYGLPCLQQLFVSMGGTTSGTGYPKDDATAKKILFDAGGVARSLTDIGNFLYDLNVRASTGKDGTGKSLSVAQWNDASMFCTGTPIQSPCDGSNKDAGPLSQDCLIYLYNNEGVGKREGPTYTNASLQYSANKDVSRYLYCRPEGRLNPTTDEGYARGRAAGGVDAVKQLYNKAHSVANDNTLSNDARKDAILDCYGDALLRQEPEVYWVGPGYDYTKDQADGVCKSFGGRVATLDEVTQAQRGGADWCATGWVGDSDTPVYPITSSTQGGCGNGSPGIKPYLPPSNKAGVNCYGPKPDIKNKGKVAEFAPGVWLRANATVVPPSGGAQCNWTHSTGGFIEGATSGGGGCFSGLSLEAAKAACCSNPTCDGFSFATDNSGGGCFKNGNAGFRPWQGYDGYRKA